MDNKDAASCTICCNPYTDSRRVPVTCAHCHHTACSKCVRTYVLSRESDADCMSCHITWNKEFLDKFMPKAFRAIDYAKHRRDILMEREKERIPQSMIAVQREKHRRSVMDQADALENDIKRVKTELTKLTNSRNDLISTANSLAMPVTSTCRENFPCSVPNCRGFFSNNFECGVCNTCFCSICFSIKDEFHVCKEEDVLSASTIMTNTKPCPKCGIRISKVDGCDQMFCVQCRTVFSWDTLFIEKGKIHNPEYFRWLRDHNQPLPAPAGDNDDDDDMDLDAIFCMEERQAVPGSQELENAFAEREDMAFYHKLQDIRQFLALQKHVSLNAARQKLEIKRPHCNQDDPNQDLRVLFILGDISEKEMKYQLYRREQYQEKAMARMQAYEMFVLAGVDLIHRAMQTLNHDQLKGIMDEFESLRVYFNDHAKSLKDRFGTWIVKHIPADWRF
jgi:hypothetical protein